MTHPHPGIVVALAIALLALAGGCGSPTQELPNGAGAEPTGATTECPATAEGSQSPPECVPPDLQVDARSNEAYRQRGDLTIENRFLAERDRVRIAEILADVAASGRLGGADVVAILRAAGFPDTVAYGGSETGGGVAFGTALENGCAYGSVRGAEVTVEIGGAIADGGCLPAQGH